MKNHLRLLAVLLFPHALPHAFACAFACASSLAAQSSWTCWLRASTTSNPSPSRETHGMVYVGSANHTLFFGGNTQQSTLSDTWLWNGLRWKKLNPTTVPTARTLHGMTYDSARNRVVMFGGVASLPDGILNDTWEWSGADWFRMAPKNNPRAVFGHALAYDSKRKKTVLFGGWTGAMRLAETWEWDGVNWTKLSPESSPTPRARFDMAYDAERDRIVLFGGESGYLLSDTWEWDGSNWTRRTLSSSPKAQAGHRMAYDASRRVIVMYGIQGAATWEYDGIKWTEVSCFVSPGSIWTGDLAYDSRHNRTVMLVATSTTTMETWEYLTTFSTFGKGCASTTGLPTISSSTPPGLGQKSLLSITGFLPRPQFGQLILGASNTRWGIIPLPLPLLVIGANNCSLYVSLDSPHPIVIDSQGSFSTNFKVPAYPGLLGVTIYGQAWAPDPNANLLGIATTNAFKVVIGR